MVRRLWRMSVALFVAVLALGVSTGSAAYAGSEASGDDGGNDDSYEALVGPAADIPCRPEAVAGGVECIAGDQSVFTLLHPSLFLQPSQYRERGEAMEPAGPVELDGRYYYGVNGDLLEFDGQRRQITERTRFPAVIDDIRADGEQLRVDIEARRHQTTMELDGDGETRTVTIEYRPGQEGAPGRGAWDWTATMAPLHDAMWLDDIDLQREPGGEDGEAAQSEESRQAALMQLQWLESVDPTNAYVPLFRGEMLEGAGDEDGARQAMEDAATHPEADWLDHTRIALRLELRGYSEMAERARSSAQEQMDAQGVRGEYVTALVNATFIFVWLQPAMAEAIAGGDTETADGLAREVDAAVPLLEGAPAAWGRLAAFLEAEGDEAGAQYWRDRADDIRGSERPDQLFEQTAEVVDLYLILQIGLFLTVLLAGAVLGLWRYEEDDLSGDDETDDDGPDAEWRQYVPRFYGADLVSLVVLFAVLLALPVMVAPQVQSMATFAEAPPAASGDAMAAPSVGDWADGLGSTSETGRLVEETQRELEATKQGERGPGEADLNSLLIDAVHADTEEREVIRLRDVDASEAALQEFEWLQPLIDLEFDTRGLLLLFLVLGMNALIFGGLLQAVARRFESVGRIGRALVPGAPNSLKMLRIPTLAVFFVGLAMMTPLSGMVQAATELSLVGYYGLEEAPAAVDSSLGTIGFALVVVALVVHAVGVVRDRPGRSSS